MRKNIKGFIVEGHVYEDVETGEHLGALWLSAPSGKVIAWDEVPSDDFGRAMRAFVNAAKILAAKSR